MAAEENVAVGADAGAEFEFEDEIAGEVGGGAQFKRALLRGAGMDGEQAIDDVVAFVVAGDFGEAVEGGAVGVVPAGEIFAVEEGDVICIGRGELGGRGGRGGGGFGVGGTAGQEESRDEECRGGSGSMARKFLAWQ